MKRVGHSPVTGVGVTGAALQSGRTVTTPRRRHCTSGAARKAAPPLRYDLEGRGGGHIGPRRESLIRPIGPLDAAAGMDGDLGVLGGRRTRIYPLRPRFNMVMHMVIQSLVLACTEHSVTNYGT